MLIEFEGINVVLDGFRPGAGLRLDAAARKFFKENGLPIDVDELRRGFLTEASPFDGLRCDQVPALWSDTDLDTFILLLVDLWNQTPFEELGGRSPAEAIDSGERPPFGPAALGASLAAFLGVPRGARPASHLENAGPRVLLKAGEWTESHLACLGRSPFQLVEEKRIPSPPDPADLPPPGMPLRTLDEDRVLLGSACSELRDCGAIRFSMSQDPRAWDILLPLLDDPEPGIVEFVLDFLQDRGARKACEAVVARMERWEDDDEALLSKAKDLLAASGVPDHLQALVGRLDEDPDPGWLTFALPAMDGGMRGEASALLMKGVEAGAGAISMWPWILLLGIREDAEEITRRCLKALRRPRTEEIPFFELARALDVDPHLQADLSHSLRPGPASVPFADEEDTSAIPVEPDPAILAGVCKDLGELGERFLGTYRPRKEGAALGEVGAWIAEAAETSAARNPAFDRAAAPLIGMGRAIAETRRRPLDGGPVADSLLSLCLLLLRRASWGRSSGEEVALLGPDASSEALLDLHLGDLISPAKALIGPLAQRVSPVALIESLSHGSIPVSFRAARALILGHGDKYLSRIEPILGRSLGHAIDLLDWGRPHLREVALLPVVRLFRRYPDMGTADLLTRTCAALATERSRTVFRRYEPHLIHLADSGNLAMDVLVLGDREAAEDFMVGIVRYYQTNGFPPEMELEGFLEAMGALHGLEDRARNAIEELRALAEKDAQEDHIPVSTPPPRPALRREGPRVGRNDPCPCGSGKKFKKCCGR